MTKQRLYRSAVVVSFILLAVALCLGTIRELLVVPIVGEQAAHIVGTLAVVMAMLVVIGFFVRRILSYCSVRDLWLVGVLWTLLTVAFEVAFFHFVAGKPWSGLLANYHPTAPAPRGR